MTKIINGNAIADKLAYSLGTEIAQLNALGLTPKLMIITINPSASAMTYVRLKQKRAKQLSIEVELADWSNSEPDKCYKMMQALASDASVNGIIVQLPIGKWDNPQPLLDLIPVPKDVDGLSSQSLVMLKEGNAPIIPATPKAIITILEESNIELTNKNILIIGQGKLVGLPLAIILIGRGYNVHTADKDTNDTTKLIKSADIIISATGHPKTIVGSMISPDTVVLDAGLSEANGRLVGDVDYQSIEGIASLVSRVPGGIGPVTVISLMQNVIEATRNSNTKVRKK